MLLKFQKKHGRNPQSSMSKQDLDDLIQIKDEVFESLDISNVLDLEDFARFEVHFLVI